MDFFSRAVLKTHTHRDRWRWKNVHICSSHLSKWQQISRKMRNWLFDAQMGHIRSCLLLQRGSVQFQIVQSACTWSWAWLHSISFSETTYSCHQNHVPICTHLAPLKSTICMLLIFGRSLAVFAFSWDWIVIWQPESESCYKLLHLNFTRLYLLY